MGDFWSNLLGNQSQQKPAPSPPTDDGPWWNRPLTPVPQPAVQQTQPSAPEQPAEPDTSRAQHAQHTQHCPGCGDDSYGGHPEQQQARPRCFACGYPVVQSGSGAAVRGDGGGEIQAARQTEASRTNNFNPQKIVHHMG